MKETDEQTPPSSVNGDEIDAMDNEIFFEEMEEVNLDDLESMLGEQEAIYTETEPPEDHSIMVFKKHTGSAFCCDLHPEGLLAVTGGEDDKSYVWSVETGDVVMDCTGHKDSVIFVGFSYDGAYVATADMAGLIKVWEVNTANLNQPWTVAFEYETEDISWGSWHYGARVLIFGVESGDIYVFKIPSGETKVLKGHMRVECGALFPDGRRLAAGYDDGALKIWDLKTSTIASQLPPEVQGEKVMAIDVQSDNNLVASISLDGNVVLMTPSNGKVVGKLQADSNLETVAFSLEPSGYLALGTLSGAVTIWDTARQMVRHQCVSAEEWSGVTKMQWIKNILLTCCLDGSLRGYEGRTGERKLMLTGHRTAILDLCYNSGKKLILTTSDDLSARVFVYDENNYNE